MYICNIAAISMTFLFVNRKFICKKKMRSLQTNIFLYLAISTLIYLFAQSTRGSVHCPTQFCAAHYCVV